MEGNRKKHVKKEQNTTNQALFFFQAEDGIRDQPRSRGLGDVYKRQMLVFIEHLTAPRSRSLPGAGHPKLGTIRSGLRGLGSGLSLIHI